MRNLISDTIHDSPEGRVSLPHPLLAAQEASAHLSPEPGLDLDGLLLPGAGVECIQCQEEEKDTQEDGLGERTGLRTFIKICLV